MQPDASMLAGLRVFVVEDEALVALNLETMLEDLGCEVVATAMRHGQACELIERGVEADVAVLDVNLGGVMAFGLASKLRDQGTPILFATGYGRQGIPAEFADCPVLQKPYPIRALAAAIREAVTAGA